MSTPVYLIDRPLTAAEKGKVAGATSFALDPQWVQPGIPLIAIDDHEKSEVNKQTIEDCLAFGDQRIGEKHVFEWFSLEGPNIWYYQKFRAYYALRNFRFRLRAVEKLAAKHEKLVLLSSEKLFAIPGQLPENVVLRLGRGPKAPILWGVLIRYAFLLALRFLIGWRQSGKLKGIQHAIINRPANEVPMVMPGTLDIKPENYYYGYILQQLDGRFLVLEEIDHPKFRGEEKYAFSRRLLRPRKGHRTLYTDYVLWRGLIFGGIRKAVKKKLRELNSRIEVLQDTDLDLTGRSILHILKSYAGSNRLYLAKYLAFRQFFGQHPVKTLSTVDENSPTIKAIWDAARAEGSQTIGMQHGGFGDQLMSYRFTPTNHQLDDPVVDTTLVWGNKWKQELIKWGSYPSGRVKVIGQPRTDIIPQLQGMKPSEVMGELDDHKRLLVFASQPQPDPELRQRAAGDIMQALKSLPDWQLVIKRHPREKDDDYYPGIARKVGFKGLIQTSSADLYKLLAASEAVITCYSTVGFEAIYFDKPLILHDPLKLDFLGVIEAGIGTRVVDVPSFIKAVHALDHPPDEEKRALLAHFKKENIFKIDGRTAQRYFAFIDHLSEELAGKST